MAAVRSVADSDIIFLPCGFCPLSSFSSLILAVADVYHTSTQGVALA